MLVYDVTDEKSFRNIPKWIRKTDELASPEVSKLLVANKCDRIKERLITKERGELLAKNLEVRYKEISALSNLNVEDAFAVLLRNVFRQACSAEACSERSVEVSSHDELPCKPQLCCGT